MGSENSSFLGRILNPFGRLFGDVLAGAVALLPLIVLVVLLDYFFGFLFGLYQYVFDKTASNSATAAVLGVGVLILFAIGYESKRKGRALLMSLLERVLEQIPVVRKIYGVLRDVFSAFSGNGKEYLGVVEVKLAGYKAIGFVTAKRTDAAGKVSYSIFVPTTPNPTTGLLLFADHDEVAFLEMTPSEAMKIVISLGSARR